MQKLYFPTNQRILLAISIFFRFILLQSECTDLAQFQLPPCCYGQVPFLEQAGSAQSVVTTDIQEDKSTSDQLLISALSHPNVTTGNGSIHRFTFLMKSFQVSPNDSRNGEDKIVFKRAPSTLPLESGNNASIIFDKVIEAEPKADYNTSFKMPSNWELFLRRALYQSMSINQTTQNFASRSTDTGQDDSTLWENIRDAPLEVIDPSTRKPSSKRIPELELTTDRISGVMVNTKDGVELRASASTFLGAPGQPCDCHLINHGDALLAYWSVGNSVPESGVEYLVYPVPHNIPTPPVFLPFHTDKILRPSPVDLNPSIQSGENLRELPFQASLDFGVHLGPKPEIGPEFAEQQLAGLKDEILHNTQRFGLGLPSNFQGVPVQPPGGPYPQFHHHVVEHFGIIPGLGNGIPPYPHPPFPQLNPHQLKEFELVRHLRKLSHEPGGPLGEPIPQPENGPPIVLPPLLNHPNSIQEIICDKGPPPDPNFVLPPQGGPAFGPFPGPGPGTEYKPGRPDYDRPRPGSDAGRPRPGDPNYGRYPGDPEYRPRPGDTDYGRYPGDPDYRPRPRPGDPDYGRYPGDPDYRPGPSDPDYRPQPGDPDYGRYPGDPDYRPRPGDPNYGERYPGQPDYPSPPRDSDPNYGGRYPENTDYRPYSQGGLQVRPKPPRNYDAERFGTSYSPPKTKYTTGVGSSGGKIRISDYRNPESASTLKKREQKLFTVSGTEPSYMLKF